MWQQTHKSKNVLPLHLLLAQTCAPLAHAQRVEADSNGPVA